MTDRNDRDRLQDFIEQLQHQPGLDSVRYERMLAELNATMPQDGHDAAPVPPVKQVGPNHDEGP